MTTKVSPHLKAPLNMIINGDMRINQRKFTTQSVPGAAVPYAADMWGAYIDVGGYDLTYDETDAPTEAEAGYHVDRCVKIESTNTTASGEATIFTGIEGFDIVHVRESQWVTLSFWAKFNYAGNFSVGFRNSNNGASYVHSFVIADTTNWNKYTLTFPIDSTSAGVWDFKNGVGLKLAICLGATFATTSTYDTWLTGNTPYAANVTDIKGASGRIAKFAAVKMEAGTEATPLVYEDQERALARCMRYYQRNPIVYGHALSATSQFFVWAFAVPMRTTPSINLLTTSPTTEHPPWAVAKTGSGSTIVGAHKDEKGCDLNMSGFTGLTAAAPSMMYYENVEAVAHPL